MYEKGDLKLTDHDCASVDEDGDCDFGHCHKVYDSRNGHQKLMVAAFLPHSCQEWVIGGKAEVEAMIKDLTEALEKL